MPNYTVNVKLISKNRPKEKLKPTGFVIHSTANIGATAENHFKLWNNTDRKSSAHYVVDWTQIINLIPENEVAWHAGRTANHKFLSVEMCEMATSDTVKFNEVWNRTVWLVADACVRYGWNTKDNVWSHNGISNMWHETTHTDPYGFLKRFGKTWADLLNAIDKKIIELKQPKPIPKPQPVPTPKPTPKPVTIDYEKEVIRILVDGKSAISLTGYTKCLTYAKNFKGKHVVLECVKDKKKWDLGIIPLPIVIDKPTTEKSQSSKVEPTKPEVKPIETPKTSEPEKTESGTARACRDLPRASRSR